MYYHHSNTGRQGVKSMSNITRKGQVTIPERIRDSFGLLPGCDVEFVIEKGEVIIRREVARRHISKCRC